MQVVVNMPESYQEVRSITFTLPHSSESIDIPCRLVHTNGDDNGAREQVLGVEFDYQAEAQLLLIENFIREIKRAQPLKVSELDEMRRLPRAICALAGATVNREDLKVISIDNISTEGLLLTLAGQVKTGEAMGFELFLPGDRRPLAIGGKVRYLVENSFRSTSSAGISFTAIKETNRTRIRNFIVTQASSMALKNLYHNLASALTDEEYKISSPSQINAIFELLRRENSLLNILFENSLKIFELSLTACHTREGRFVTSANSEIEGSLLKDSELIYFSFYLNGGCYYFKSELLKLTDQELIFAIPPLLYRSEKRSYQRKLLGDDIRLSFDQGTPNNNDLQAKLVDISRRGFLCEVPLTSAVEHSLRLGQQVQYELNEVLELDNHGEVRHLTEAMGTDGVMVIRIGIEAGIKRFPYKFKKFGSREWNERKLYELDISLQNGSKIISKVISFTNKKGRKIAALINTTGNCKTAPVIILPPAFGKKKETLSPLVSTLLANFHHFNQDLITIRYDGINRPGESYNQEGRAKRGYEMLHYRISQGLDDLETTLDYVYNNPHFKPTKVILITFSMPALDARRLLANRQEQRVDFWISVMGLTSAQGALSNILGGMDIIGNYKMNIPNGINGMLGHLVDMDNLAEDLIANKYAFITDARLDMSKISIPVLWIYGAYDKWLDINEIKDIMSIKTDGERRIIEVPTGHNLHSSDDAVKTFQVITSAVYRNLNNREVEVVDPDKEEMLRLITYERERILHAQDFQVEQYWKEYLIGCTNNSYGYDFYRNIKDFRDFLSLEVNLLNPVDHDHIGDMGCGTGLLIDNMLHNLVRRHSPVKNLNITAVDLIPEALEKTKEKYEILCNSHNFLRDYKLEYIEMNLEPNRLIPVKEFLADTTLDLEFLRGRVEGLKNRTIDQLINKRSKKLFTLLRGALPAEPELEQLKKKLTANEYDTVIDFNRAVRFLKRELTCRDLKTPVLKVRGIRSATSLDTRQYSHLRTGDLCFKNLNFGNHGLKVNLDFRDQLFSKIAASLFISYIFNADYLMTEFFRILQPGGTLLVSSMKPDSDISIIFTDYIKKIRDLELQDTEIKSLDLNLTGARLMLNEAAALFELEEEGYFKFYNEEELSLLFAGAGFTDIRANHSLGNPPQAVIVTGIKREAQVDLTVPGREEEYDNS
ncbi:hypothetical protein ES705_05984 [subsurface metagenome]